MQTIGGFQRSTLIDYPGKVACSVFFNGCNFRCGFCHNPFLIFHSSELITKEEVLKFLDKRVGLLDGVVLSGGEPCMFSEVVEFAAKIKEKGFLVKLDTNGAFPDVLERLIPYLDYIAMDIKGSKEMYSKVCGVGVNLENVKRSVSLIKGSGVKHEFRTTVVPGLFDICEMQKICEWLGKGKYVIQGFVSKGDHVDPSFNGKRGFREEEIKEFVKVAEECFSVEVRNV